jgi:hypothetical protein
LPLPNCQETDQNEEAVNCRDISKDVWNFSWYVKIYAGTAGTGVAGTAGTWVLSRCLTFWQLNLAFKS